MKTGTLIIVVLLSILAGMMVYGSFKTSNVVKEDTFNNAAGGDTFKGVITNMKLEPQKIDGKGVYDKSCNMIGNGLTQCDAGIQTEKGLLNFNYKHNMAAQPCISEGDNFKVEILEGGEAIVTRV